MFKNVQNDTSKYKCDSCGYEPCPYTDKETCEIITDKIRDDAFNEHDCSDDCEHEDYEEEDYAD